MQKLQYVLLVLTVSLPIAWTCQEQTEIDFGTIDGKIVDASGFPVSNLTVMRVVDDVNVDDSIAYSVTDISGVFKIERGFPYVFTPSSSGCNSHGFQYGGMVPFLLVIERPFIDTLYVYVTSFPTIQGFGDTTIVIPDDANNLLARTIPTIVVQ
jgi:hypothetical protein